MRAIVERLYNKKVEATGLAIFRIFYFLIFLFEVIQLFYFRHLIYDKIPYVEYAEIDVSIPLILWMVTIGFIIVGLFTRTALILNYLFCIFFIATIKTYEYHMFYIYMSVNFLLLFINISKVYSLDRLLLILKYSNTRFTYKPPNKVSVLNYFVILLVGIGFVYMDSVFYKYASDIWLNGLGVWLPASVAQITNINTSWILNQKWLIIFLGYLTLVFETIFIFTFFRKRWRVPLLIIGFGLHIGIVIQFPIPWFGLGYSCIYLLLVPLAWWKAISERLKFKSKRLTFYYDEECPLCNRTKIILSYFDVFGAIDFKGLQTYGFDNEKLQKYSQDELLDNIYSITTNKGKVLIGIDTYVFSFKQIPVFLILGWLLSIPGIYHFAKFIYQKIAESRYVDRCTEDNCGYEVPNLPKENHDMKLTKSFTLKDLKVSFILFGILLLTFLQINVTYHSNLSNNIQNSLGLTESSSIRKQIDKISYPIWYSGQRLFGISKHAVFVDSHFENYNHTIGLTYLNKKGQEIWLPITNSDGTLGLWQVGPIWAKWGFRINSPEVNQKRLSNGIRDFTAFWAYKNNLSLDDAVFNIKVKKNSSPTKWEKDFLNKQLANPWIDGGKVKWLNQEFFEELKIIEEL